MLYVTLWHCVIMKFVNCFHLITGTRNPPCLNIKVLNALCCLMYFHAQVVATCVPRSNVMFVLLKPHSMTEKEQHHTIYRTLHLCYVRVCGSQMHAIYKKRNICYTVDNLFAHMRTIKIYSCFQFN